jgi:nitric oxide dioxygenase
LGFEQPESPGLVSRTPSDVDPTQTALVQRSFAIIAPIADDAAALFYQRLFELDPSLRHMFPEDMTGSARS